MDHHIKKAMPNLDALDGAERTPFPSYTWLESLTEGAVKVLLCAHTTKAKDINPRKIRQFCDDFQTELLAARKQLFAEFKEGQVATWEDCRKLAIEATRLLHERVKAHLEKDSAHGT